jgi:citrate synthase
MQAASTAKSVTGELSQIRTDIAASDLHHIWIRGHDLAGEVIGSRSFGEVIFLLVGGRFPNPQELRLVDAMLVSLVEHGLTPSAMVARVTYAVAPESLQGAVAAGLLGAGGVVLGSMEDCGRLLTQVADDVRNGSTRQAAIARIVTDYKSARKHLPGIGHAIHTEGDPRAVRLYELAEECEHRGEYLESLEQLASAAGRENKRLPINVTGAVAAILLELGIPWQLHRGFALISRGAGLIAHIGEEVDQPITPALRNLLQRGDAQAAI